MINIVTCVTGITLLYDESSHYLENAVIGSPRLQLMTEMKSYATSISMECQFLDSGSRMAQVYTSQSLVETTGDTISRNRFKNLRALIDRSHLDYI